MKLSRSLFGAVALLMLSSSAWAGGLFLPARGARALGRGGAFTAGVDDGSAIYYNPAGLVDAGEFHFLLDGALDFQQASYTRVDSGGNPQPKVNGSMNVLPLPTLTLGGLVPNTDKRLALAGGIWVPYLGVNSWPEKGPQRYSNISINGSLIAVAELAAAYKIADWFWVGAGIENMFIHFHSRVMLSACSQLNCAPEDPGFDSLTQVDTDSWFTPSGVVGAIFALPKFRGGVNVQLPFWVRSSGTVQSRLPTDPFFANSELHAFNNKDNPNCAVRTDACKVDVNFDLPLQLRLGGEWRPIEPLRLELDLQYESWSMQQNFTVKPKGVYLSGVPGIGNYYLGTMYVVRGLQDTFAVNLGAELEAVKNILTLRLGYAFETSATPDNTASVLTPDALRNILSLGGSLTIHANRRMAIRGDLAYAHVFFADRNVTNSKSLQLNPIQPALAVAVGDGKYNIAADVITLGLSVRYK
jgi:long-chain fatty acid transport protein